MPFQPSSARTRYLLGIASVIAAALVHAGLALFGLDAGLAPHAAAIAATAWYAGAGPAVLAILLSLAYGLYAPVAPALADTRTLIACVLWLLCGFALTYVMLALRRRRDLDAFALHACADAVVVADARDRIIEMNPAAQALIAGDAADAAHGSALLGTELAALAAASSGSSWEWVREDPQRGSYVFAVTTSRIRSLARSRTVYVLHDLTDRTARHRAVAATPAIERVQSMVDASDARMFHVDRQFHLTWSNRSLRERHGIADGTRADVSTLFDAPMRAALLRPLQRAMDGQRETLEWRALDARGQSEWTFAMITPDLDADGTVRGCFVLCVDADAWHGEDIIRQRSEDQRRGVLESLPDLVWMATADGTGEWFNHRWAAYTGRSVTADWTDPMPADDHERVVGAWQLAKAQGVPLAVECRLRRHDGVLRWHLVRMQPLRESVTDSAIWGWCGSCTDIDDRKQAEVALRTTQQRIGTFLGTLSHELRNPLAAMSAAIQILRHPRAAPAMSARAMDTLERQSTLLARMVEELLDAARLMDGRIDLQRRCVVLNHLLTEVCEDLAPRAAERGVNLSCVVPERTILVDADMLRIKQAVENLAINALEACAAGETVTISTIDDAGEAGIRVADSGCGLSAESLATLFDLGSAARYDKGSGGGLGLGLKAVNRIMQLHGGRIVAASDGPGKGSTFDLFLPLHDARGAAPAIEHDVRRDNLLRGQRVLIIGNTGIPDDTLSAQIERCGAEHVQVARNGFDGLRLLASLQPTVLVCSLDLPPPLSGYDVVREVTRLAETRPRLVAVGDDGALDFAKARAAGFDDCLIKPVSLSRLLDTLAHAHAFPIAVT